MHVVVRITRYITEWVVKKGQGQSPLGFVTQQPKFITLIQLIANGVTSVMYFFAVGLVLEEFGVNLTAYLASASIIGVGHQLRLARLGPGYGHRRDADFLGRAWTSGTWWRSPAPSWSSGASRKLDCGSPSSSICSTRMVFIPNRTIANVSRFPLGGVYAYADILIPAGVGAEKVAQIVGKLPKGCGCNSAPSSSASRDRRRGNGDGRRLEFLRAHFKIWPGQGNLIETTFRQQIVSAMKSFHPEYADWQVPVTYRAMAAPKNIKPPLAPPPDKPPA